ncbi:MAG: hypothetical protein IH968_12930 [Gemmatimonadetes bacterium]|nr:hypothetical protein [Gemmatimonadota bacterium]
MPPPWRVAQPGLRPGEKLAEELTAPEEVTIPTLVDKIHLVETVISDATMARLEPFLAGMEGSKEAFVSGAIRRNLMELVEGNEAGAISQEGTGIAKTKALSRFAKT